MTRGAIIRISGDWLLLLLRTHLGLDCLAGAGCDDALMRQRGVVSVKVHGPGLPEVADGSPYPTLELGDVGPPSPAIGWHYHWDDGGSGAPPRGPDEADQPVVVRGTEGG